jgi:hypothetical protein
MAKSQTILQLIIGSPSDVSTERRIVEEVISNLNKSWSDHLGIRIEPKTWEQNSTPGVGRYAQDVINKQLLTDFDIFLAIFWSRIGSPTPEAVSGTVEEYEKAKRKFDSDNNSSRIMLYFKDAPVPPSQIDPSQLAAVQRFQERVKSDGVLYYTFGDSEEFRRVLQFHLSAEVQSWGRDWGPKIESPRVPESQLSETGLAPEESSMDQEEGFIDLIVGGEDDFSRMIESMNRMSTASRELTTKTHERTAELIQAKQTGVNPDYRKIKRINDLAADDLINYADRTAAEIPIFSQAFSLGADKYMRALLFVRPEEAIDQADVNNAVHSVSELQDVMNSTLEQLKEFRSVVSYLPKSTGHFVFAQKKAMRVLDEFYSEVISTIAICDVLLDSLRRFLRKH